jgi:hypothetical protein
MGPSSSPIVRSIAAGGPRAPAGPRRARFAIGAGIVLFLAWLAWQGYRNPDLLLGLAAFRLC